MTNKEEALQQYQQFRAVSRTVNERLLKKLPRGAIKACGKRLGVFKKGTLILGEEELPLFLDYSLYHYRTGGRNTIEAALADDLYPPGSEERAVLEVEKQTYPTLFRVELAEQGYGIHAYELLGERSIFLMDQGFSYSATPGLVMSANLIPLSDFYLTSGAAFFLDGRALWQVDDKIERWENRVGEIDWNDLPPERSDRLATILVRAALDHGVMARMHYVDEDELRTLMGTGKRRGEGQWPKKKE